jgi:hypothetical protein
MELPLLSMDMECKDRYLLIFHTFSNKSLKISSKFEYLEITATDQNTLTSNYKQIEVVNVSRL